MSDREDLLVALGHDVGKYVARAARNLARDLESGVEVSSGMLGLLCQDLYELRDGRRASEVLAARTGPVREDPRIRRAEALLAEVDALEDEVRAADPKAVERAVEIALEVEALLRGHLRGPRGGPE